MLHETEALKRASILNRLHQTSESFARTEKDMREVISYRLGQFAADVLPLRRQLAETLRQRIDGKESRLKNLEEKLKLSNPAKKSREGWAEITVKGKRKALAEIDEKEEFDLTDGKIKMKAQCLGKDFLT